MLLTRYLKCIKGTRLYRFDRCSDYAIEYIKGRKYRTKLSLVAKGHRLVNGISVECWE